MGARLWQLWHLASNIVCPSRAAVLPEDEPLEEDVVGTGVDLAHALRININMMTLAKTIIVYFFICPPLNYENYDIFGIKSAIRDSESDTLNSLA